SLHLHHSRISRTPFIARVFGFFLVWGETGVANKAGAVGVKGGCGRRWVVGAPYRRRAESRFRMRRRRPGRPMPVTVGRRHAPTAVQLPAALQDCDASRGI